MPDSRTDSRACAAREIVGVADRNERGSTVFAQGKVAKARRLIAPVVEWFSEGHDTTDVKAARAILDEAS